MLIQRIIVSVERWGDVEFIESKIPTIWNVLTDEVWGSTIVLLGGLLILWLGVRKSLSIAVKYQQTLCGGEIRPKGKLTAIKKSNLDTLPILETCTHNELDRMLTIDTPIQAVRFVKPEAQVVRPTTLPVVLSCENNPFKRFRNRFLSIPKPQIIVKQFIENGIIIDEENTDGAEIKVELYKRATPL